MMVVTERTRHICAAYCKAIDAGEDSSSVVGWLSAINDVQRPAIWKALRRGGVIAPYAPKVTGGNGRPSGGGVPGYTASRRMATQGRIDSRAAMDSAPRVSRDPCPRCGVRGDLECGHSGVRLGMVL